VRASAASERLLRTYTRRGLEKTLFQLTIVLSVLWLAISAIAVYER
jgi:preprotein translocase subunit SecG